MELTRRRVLQGMSAGAALLPFVPLLGARAQDGEVPKRIVFFYSSNGTIRERWLPSMQNGELVLSEILTPLEAFKSRLLVVDGLRSAAPFEKGTHAGHEGGITGALTGQGNEFYPGADYDAYPLGESVDQAIARQVSSGLKYPSLQLGIQVDDYSPTVACSSWSGPMQPLYPDNDPYNVFDRVFSGLDPSGVMPDAGASELIASRKSVIDLVRGDLNGLRGRLPTQERDKVEAHLEAIRQIENTLLTGQGASATEACAIPDPGGRIGIYENDNIPALGRIQMDLLVMALACDLTRVATIQYGRAGALHRFSWLGSEFLSDPDNGPEDDTFGLHGLAHNDANESSRVKLAKCHAWYAGEMAHLMGKLDAIPEGDGTMLDHTLVVWFNEMGTGSDHSLTNTPWVIGGNVDGYFRTGRLVSFPDEANNKLLVSLAQAMGLDIEAFGDPDFGQGNLTGLT